MKQNTQKVRAHVILKNRRGFPHEHPGDYLEKPSMADEVEKALEELGCKVAYKTPHSVAIEMDAQLFEHSFGGMLIWMESGWIWTGSITLPKTLESKVSKIVMNEPARYITN